MERGEKRRLRLSLPPPSRFRSHICSLCCDSRTVAKGDGRKDQRLGKCWRLRGNYSSPTKERLLKSRSSTFCFLPSASLQPPSPLSLLNPIPSRCDPPSSAEPNWNLSRSCSRTRCVLSPIQARRKEREEGRKEGKLASFLFFRLSFLLLACSSLSLSCADGYLSSSRRFSFACRACS